MTTRKPYKVMDRTRSVKKGVMASSLEDFTISSKRKLAYSGDREVSVVLEEDGTEVDDNDYFQTLEPNTCLMLLYAGERWSPFSVASDDVTDHGDQEESGRLQALLARLKTDPGTIALLSGADMELLAEMDLTSPGVTFPRYEARFLLHLQEAAQRHLAEKSQIRDTLALLQIYHKVGGEPEPEEKGEKRENVARRESARKRQKASKDQDTVDRK